MDNIEYAWECNECGSQEYTMCVSYEDACWMGCAGCGADEFHKVVATNDNEKEQ
jgi:predicted nucleic acid-binding Zn ribbon protein